MVKIAWVSRHPPLPAQIKELERIFGEVELIQISKVFRDAKDVLEDVKKAFNYGAIEVLLIADEFLREQRETWDIDSFLRDVELSKGKIVIMSTEFEPGKRLMALGGIAALLRFDID